MKSSDVAMIALGSNLVSKYGQPKQVLEYALSEVDRADSRVKRCSAWWRTPAFPLGSGPEYINAVALLEITISPPKLLSRLHAIEASLGRTRGARWEARIVDLDLLAVGDQIAPDVATLKDWMDLTPEETMRRAPDDLVLPHPRLHERSFVLAPMADVAPDWRHPLLGKTVMEMLQALPEEALTLITRLRDNL